MPELPEVETVRRGLERVLVGRRITAVEVGRERTVRRTSREALVAGLTATTVTAARRRGKYLLCPLDSGDELMIHLRMSGRLLAAAAGAPRPAHTHVVLHLDPATDSSGELWFVDPRTFGEMVVFDPDRRDVEVPELGRLGVDPVVDGLDRDTLASLLAARRGRLKAVLLDQHVVAGIGNIYADETLHRARLRPDRRADTLSSREVGRLHGSLLEVLEEAIEAGGSTLDDTQYVDPEGRHGWFQVHHLVYGRAGQRCLSCGRADIVRSVEAGRTTSWCPRCQR
ncbi:MAG: bifunctional DNA-formamidopyrimidine glycosylase/DNA-(apurinic or apyrimidinic site) lyase [Ilumatobacteraceae bacterium]